MSRIVLPVCLVALLLTSVDALGQVAKQSDVRQQALRVEGRISSALGVTRSQTPIVCLFGREDLDFKTPKTRVLLVGGLDGSAESVDGTLAALKWFHRAAEAKGLRERFSLSAVPCANPDAWLARKGPSNLSGGNPLRGYPPKGEAYSSPTDPEAAYLWRWIGLHAPDLVVVILSGKELRWAVPESSDEKLEALRKALKPAAAAPEAGRLAAELVRVAPARVGTVQALEVFVPNASPKKALRSLLMQMEKVNFRGPSPARRELRRRLEHSPVEVARQLAKVYGHELRSVEYIAAMALVGRLRLGELTKDPGHRADVERLVAPYVSGTKVALPEQAAGPVFAGHLVFAELARGAKEPRYLELVRRAADRAFDTRGKPLDVLPGHNEMSDAVFMHCPLLARAGHLTGEKKYFEALERNLAFLRRLTLRRDGLYRHSPLDEAAWGRGNGFPALGLALSLSEVPDDYPGRPALLRAFREHLAALLDQQDPTGAWHQVIDVPGSYRELTCTCMITVAMVRGVRNGWLDRGKYEPAIRRAWEAIATRISNGELVDVCTGTGKQKDLRAYLDRTAILGRDPRGGAMAMLAAVELAEWEASGRRENRRLR
jgi:rhamnogalacturonyl hydrolase YesR